MVYTREIYWNVGHGAGTLIPMYLLTLAALALLARGIGQRLKVYRQGRTLNRTDALPARAATALRQLFSQARVLRVPGAGTAHGLFFWGFFLLFIGTCLIVVQADFADPLFGITFLRGDFYLLFSLVLDVAGALAILMLAGLAVRRYLVRPAGLETRRDDALSLVLLFAILITGFIIEGARMAATELGTGLAAWSPVGLLFAKALAGLGPQGLRTLHAGLWWLHLLLALSFIALIPYTKLRHLLTTSANYLFADRRPTGALVTLDLEDESVESFGAARITDLTWKDLFDSDACTRCKRCQDRCPAHATDKPLSPMKVVNQLQEIAFDTPEANLIEACGKDALWSCTTCRACQEICPAAIEHVPKIVEMRRNLVLMEGEFPGEEVMTAAENAEVNGNPLGMAFSARGDWAQELGVKTLAEDPEVDVLYFVGCYASFDKRNIKVATSFVQLCQAAGLKVGILGKEEKCCGEPLRKLGNEYLYQSLASREHRADEGLRGEAGRHHLSALLQHPEQGLSRSRLCRRGRALQRLSRTPPRRRSAAAGPGGELRLHLPRQLLPGALQWPLSGAAHPDPGGRRRADGDGETPGAELLLRRRRRPHPRRGEAGHAHRRGTGAPGRGDRRAAASVQLSFLPDHVRGRHQGGRFRRDPGAEGHRRGAGGATLSI